MKHLATVLCSLLTMNSIFAMERKIVVYNKNISNEGQYNGVGVDLRSFDSVGFKRSWHPIEDGQQKAIDYEKNYQIIPILRIHASVPREVKLLVTEDGPLQVGDTITITDNEEGISVSNQTGKISLLLAKASKLVKIGSNPENFTLKQYVPQQTLTVRNKNLAQITLWHAAVRNTAEPFVFYIPSARTRDADLELRKNDDLLEQIMHHLRQGEEKMLTTFSSNDNVGMTATLTKLLIPQALQDVQVHINDGKIKSGDTLEISYSKEDNTISIVNQHGQMLATLYTTESVVTLG